MVRKPEGRGMDVHDLPSFMVLFTAMQTPEEQWYADKVHPSPEGKKDADTGDVEVVVADSAAGDVAVRAINAAKFRLSTIERQLAKCWNFGRDDFTTQVSQWWAPELQARERSLDHFAEMGRENDGTD